MIGKSCFECMIHVTTNALARPTPKFLPAPSVKCLRVVNEFSSCENRYTSWVACFQGTYDKLYKEVPTYKLITPSIVSERLKVRGSLARRALLELEEKGLIRKVRKENSSIFYFCCLLFKYFDNFTLLPGSVAVPGCFFRIRIFSIPSHPH
jgi:hypothetical protein